MAGAPSRHTVSKAMGDHPCLMELQFGLSCHQIRRVGGPEGQNDRIPTCVQPCLLRIPGTSLTHAPGRGASQRARHASAAKKNAMANSHVPDVSSEASPTTVISFIGADMRGVIHRRPGLTEQSGNTR